MSIGAMHARRLVLTVRKRRCRAGEQPSARVCSDGAMAGKSEEGADMAKAPVSGDACQGN